MGLLQPGDRVDVILSIGEFGNPQAGRGVVVLQNVLVLAYGLEVHRERSSSGETSSSVSTSTNVTLQLTVDESALLTQARSPSGYIQLMLRNPNDTVVTTARVPDVRWEDMIDLTRRARFLRVAVRSLIPPALAPVEPVLDPASAERASGAGALTPSVAPRAGAATTSP